MYAIRSYYSIFCHTPAELRRRVHRAVVAGLRPGGVLILEAYTPRQLEFGTGGPPVVELMIVITSYSIHYTKLYDSFPRDFSAGH